jgi:hypothetical protein
MRRRSLGEQDTYSAAQWMPLPRSGRTSSESKASSEWYFEVEILGARFGGTNEEAPEIGIGVSGLLTDELLTAHPGWNPGSCGFHCDNAKLYEGREEGESTGGVPSRVGDKIRCIVATESHSEARCTVRFLHNGKQVATAELEGPIYPVVALTNPGEKVKVSLVVPH